MSAVSLDEAWGDSFASAPTPNAKHHSTTAHSPRSHGSQQSSNSSPPPPHRSTRRALSIHDEDEIDLVSCLHALQKVSAELKDLKMLFGRQQHEQKSVLYVAIGVVIVLLLFTAHSYSRLQYASDCMLHWKQI